MFVEPNDCIVELLNAPYDTTYASLLQFFHGLTVVDMLRTKNCITGNQSTILVMFSTMREKREALGRIGTELLGQRINMNRVFWRSSFYAADSGLYVVSTGFFFQNRPEAVRTLAMNCLSPNGFHQPDSRIASKTPNLVQNPPQVVEKPLVAKPEPMNIYYLHANQDQDHPGVASDRFGRKIVLEFARPQMLECISNDRPSHAIQIVDPATIQPARPPPSAPKNTTSSRRTHAIKIVDPATLNPNSKGKEPMHTPITHSSLSPTTAQTPSTIESTLPTLTTQPTPSTQPILKDQPCEAYIDFVANPTRPCPPPPFVKPNVVFDDSKWNLNGHDAYDKSKNVITPSDWHKFSHDMFIEAMQEYEMAKRGYWGDDA